MRFRTQVADVSIFTRVVQSIGKVANKCILKLTPDKIHIICLGDTDGTQIWSQMQVDSIFTDYRIESNFQNRINLEVSPDTLLKALRSANNAYSVILRLAKRNKDPLLSFSISAQSHTGAKLEVVQDVLIKVLKPAEMSRIVEPLCPEPDVHIILPKLLHLRTVADHMRSLSDVVTLSANRRGELRLSVVEDEVSLDTTWSHLAHPTIDASQPSTAQNQPSNPDEHKSVNLEMKSFLKFLSSYIVATTTIACICANHCAIFYVYIGDVDKSSGVMTRRLTLLLTPALSTSNVFTYLVGSIWIALLLLHLSSEIEVLDDPQSARSNRYTVAVLLSHGFGIAFPKAMVGALLEMLDEGVKSDMIVTAVGITTLLFSEQGGL